MPAYAVGQVVYLLQTKSLSVVPVQVAEQITKNTLIGSETVYNVKIPGKEKMLDLLDRIQQKQIQSKKVRRHLLIKKNTMIQNQQIKNLNQKMMWRKNNW